MPGVKEMKKVLITAGPIGGQLDPNKLVTNRCRGIWACRFAEILTEGYGYDVTLLTSKTFFPDNIPEEATWVKCTDYYDYRAKCQEFAKTHDAAVMAAAVVNWLPTDPYPLEGKMPTHGYNPGDIIQIPFMLMPRVIEDMKKINPRITLIGCKLLSGVTEEELIETAYAQVLLTSKCNVVVANDLTNLRKKFLVYQDRTVQVCDDNFTAMFKHLVKIIEDEHYQTALDKTDHPILGQGSKNAGIFDAVVDKYRDRFTQRAAGSDRVFGSVYVPNAPQYLEYGCTSVVGYCSPREKGRMFSAKDAIAITHLGRDSLNVSGPSKATLNAPLLVRMAQAYPGATAILHLHEQLPDMPTVLYAPPGTVQDNNRGIPGPVFNIEGHGFIACLDENLEIYK